MLCIWVILQVFDGMVRILGEYLSTIYIGDKYNFFFYQQTEGYPLRRNHMIEKGVQIDLLENGN